MVAKISTPPQTSIAVAEHHKHGNVKKKLKSIEHHLQSAVKEVFAFVRAAVLFPVNLDKASKLKKNISLNPKSAPILLVHGYLHNSSGWILMKKKLEAKGHKVFTINLGSPLSSIESYAEKVKKKAQDIAKLTNRQDLILIGHSMGGLVSTKYAVDLAPEGTVKKVITIGTPLYGSPFAPIGIGKCAKQMKKGSPFLKDLHKKMEGKEKEIAFFHMASQTDLIVPADRAIRNNTPTERTRVFSNLGHIGLLYSRRVAESVMEYLK